jgi:hypothetical protein
MQLLIAAAAHTFLSARNVSPFRIAAAHWRGPVHSRVRPAKACSVFPEHRQTGHIAGSVSYVCKQRILTRTDSQIIRRERTWHRRTQIGQDEEKVPRRHGAVGFVRRQARRVCSAIFPARRHLGNATTRPPAATRRSTASTLTAADYSLQLVATVSRSLTRPTFHPCMCPARPARQRPERLRSDRAAPIRPPAPTSRSVAGSGIGSAVG